MKKRKKTKVIPYTEQLKNMYETTKDIRPDTTNGEICCENRSKSLRDALEKRDEVKNANSKKAK